MARPSSLVHVEIAPNLHPIFAAALAAIPEGARPAPPFHRDGPRPKLTVDGITRAALVCARHVRGKVSRAQLDEFDRLVALAERALGPTPPRDAPWLVDLRGARTIREHSRGALKVVALACESAVEDPLRACDRAGEAAALAMQLSTPEEQRALAVALDDDITLSEAEELARRAKLERSILRVVRRWEGPRLLVLHDDGLASLLAQNEKKRWTSTTLALDVLLARVSPPAPTAHQDRVFHARFGDGEVVARDPGPPPKLEVRFDGETKTRWLLADKLTMR